MEEKLHGGVISQDEAVTAISRAIRWARVGPKNPNRPIASFIFSGPTVRNTAQKLGKSFERLPHSSDCKAGKGNGASSARGSESDTNKLTTVTSNDGVEALLVVVVDGSHHDRGWVFDSEATTHFFEFLLIVVYFRVAICPLGFPTPTGVGKSELAKTLAAYFFGSEEAMIQLDMNEFMERHTVSKLIGSPPGYIGYTEGGQLTEAVHRRPYSVVLFDEIEKAHPDVFIMMLQILEDGRLTDSKGRTVNFKNTLLIMTSNIRSRVIEKGGRSIGFDLDFDQKENSYNCIKSLVTEELKQYFRPEFLNRLDEMIVFRQLTKLGVKEISEIMMKEVFERLRLKKIELQVTEKFKDRVVDEGYDPSYGVRPLRRAIMRLLEDSMALKMLSGEIKKGDSVIVDVDVDGKVIVLLNSSIGSPELLPREILL
ncbi:hypothetical protein GIB67_025263 [Kingdonia uniflora]|uniref:Uncharacterized protein n=1 Tax=Kingdonia uniflora TaxID=39325 RepID=A0A7J7NBB9_9MAGN|nr:hypothetical protein GIB67_025263 [Kingdonia uniflora]